ncbi:MAG: carbohydrate ABC transporter permease [Clostridiaceae bacterium]|nr:carbohydrate ABC transporter permease [Clostridiaceae bacterium]
MTRKKKMKLRSAGFRDCLFDGFLNLFLIVSTLIVLYPLVYIVSASFSAPQAVVSGRVWLLPVDPSLIGYRAVFKNSNILTGYLNSLIYAVLGTGVNLVLTVLAAYPLARKDFCGKNIFMGLFVFTMLFSGGLIPTYLVVYNLQMINTWWAMILPGAMSVWNVILVRTYIQQTIPEELFESANLDGCNKFRILPSLIIPLSGPILAVIALYCMVGSWNSYFDALIYLTKKELFPLQIVLRNILIVNQIDASMVADVKEIARKQGMINILKYAIIVVSSLPLIMIYPFVQRYFVKGVMLGSLKG